MKTINKEIALKIEIAYDLDHNVSDDIKDSLLELSDENCPLCEGLGSYEVVDLFYIKELVCSCVYESLSATKEV